MLNFLQKYFFSSHLLKDYNKKKLLLIFTNNENFQQILQRDIKIAKANSIISSIAHNNQILKPQFFNQIWKKYVYFIEKVYKTNSQDATIQQMFILFINIIKIFQRHKKITSQNLIKIFNKLGNQLSQNIQSFELKDQLLIILSIIIYNKKKGQHIFLKHKTRLYAIMHQFKFEQSLLLIQILVKTHIYLTQWFEYSFNQIYPQIQKLNFKQLSKIVHLLSLSKRFINRAFIIKLVNNIVVNFKQYKLKQKIELFHEVTIIQKYNKSSVNYIYEFDEFYQMVINEVENSIQYLNSRQLKTFVEALRRSAIYKEDLILILIKIHMKRQLIQLKNLEQQENQQEQQKIQKNHLNITLQNLFNMIHLLATFDIKHHKFIKYFQQVLILAYQNNNKILKGYNFLNRVLWSICVLSSPKQAENVIKIILNEITEKQQNINQGDARNIFFCFQYLRFTNPSLISPQLKTKIQQSVKDLYHVSYVSIPHQQITNQLFNLGIPCIQQYNVNNLACDICIPDLGNFFNEPTDKIKNIIIDVHGYQHFLRNVNKVKGNSKLKQKLLQFEGYKYFYIPLDQWQISENKQQYLKNFLKDIYDYCLKKTT